MVPRAQGMSIWAVLIPLAAALVLAAAVTRVFGTVPLTICLLTLIAVVITAVHHAEVIARRIGEPYGSLVLALAITIIEVALILSLMYTDPTSNPNLLRDTIFSTIMITSNAGVGLCQLLGGLRHHEPEFRMEGANIGLSTLIALSTLILVLPNFTTSSPGPTYTSAQLIFAAIASLFLWTMFVLMQTVRHQEYFVLAVYEMEPLPAPSIAVTLASFTLLVVTLVTVVGFAEVLSPGIEALVTRVGAPRPVIGICIAMIVLLPETTAAVRAAWDNRLQTSLNLVFGSALASIGLTIPVVSAAALMWEGPLNLGLEAKNVVLLALTFVVASTTLVAGRTHVMHGTVHLVIFAAFLFLAVVP